MKRATASLALCFAVGAPLHAQVRAPETVVMRAARDELARTMAELRLDKADRPYFVAYTITENDFANASASAGSMLGSGRNRGRSLAVEVRVGDYTFDNTNFFATPDISAGGMRTYLGFMELPLDDDYLAIRRQLWLATDAAYKQALESLAGKRAALVNRTRADSLADFAKAEPTQTTDEVPPAVLDLAAAQALVRDLSRAGTSPGVYASSVTLSATNTRTFYINSEGTTYERLRPAVTLGASASTQATDGMPLSASLKYSARSMSGIPARDQLNAKLREMLARLDTIRSAPLPDRYNGPVLFEGLAAVELFGEQFAPSLAASRKPVSGNAQAERLATMLGRGQSNSALSEKLGARVLPEFMNVVDDPTITQHGNAPMLGGYTVDDQGTRTRPTRLVENGILKTLLAGRTPVEGVARSTGNFRGGTVAPSNLVVEATNGLSDAALRDRLLALAKARGLPFAIVVRAIGGAPAGDASSMIADMMASMMPGRAAEKGRNVYLAYRLYADGHEECVRGAQVLGLGMDAFKTIVAASAQATVLQGAGASGFTAIMAAATGGSSEAWFAVPSLLFDDLTVIKRADEMPKPPISAPPGVPR